jgi:hypothetical protein
MKEEKYNPYGDYIHIDAEGVRKMIANGCDWGELYHPSESKPVKGMSTRHKAETPASGKKLDMRYLLIG